MGYSIVGILVSGVVISIAELRYVANTFASLGIPFQSLNHVILTVLSSP
jgi:hypothetical protein